MWPGFSRLFYSISVFQRMHTARSPSSIPSGISGDALDLSLSGSQLTMSKRPSSASPGKYFSRSVSVASENRGKRNTLVRHCQKVPVCGIKCSRCMNEKKKQPLLSGCAKFTERHQIWWLPFRQEPSTIQQHHSG